MTRFARGCVAALLLGLTWGAMAWVSAEEANIAMCDNCFALGSGARATQPYSIVAASDGETICQFDGEKRYARGEKYKHLACNEWREKLVKAAMHIQHYDGASLTFMVCSQADPCMSRPLNYEIIRDRLLQQLR